MYQIQKPSPTLMDYIKVGEGFTIEKIIIYSTDCNLPKVNWYISWFCP